MGGPDDDRPADSKMIGAVPSGCWTPEVGPVFTDFSFRGNYPSIPTFDYSLVSPISYSLSRSSSKMSTSSLLVVERLLLLLMPFLASVMAKRSPLLHSIGSSRMAAEGKGRRAREQPVNGGKAMMMGLFVDPHIVLVQRKAVSLDLSCSLPF